MPGETLLPLFTSSPPPRRHARQECPSSHGTNGQNLRKTSYRAGRRRRQKTAVEILQRAASGLLFQKLPCRRLSTPLPRCCNVRHGAVETRPESPLPAELRHTASDKRHLKAFLDHIRRIKDTDMRMSARGASVSQRPPVPDAEAENSCSSRKRPCRKRRGKRASLRPYGYREGGRVWESRSCATERAVHGLDLPRPSTQCAGRGPSGKGAPPA